MTRLEALTALKEAVEAGQPSSHFIWTRALRLDYGLGYKAAGGSLDAARALHEAVLPRHYAQVHMWAVPEMSRVDIGGGHTGRADCPARAWLIAILAALIAQEQDQ